MEDHNHFIGSLRAAPQDVSLPILQDLLTQGYDTLTFNRSPSSVDALCISRDGDQLSLADHLASLQHAAPVFELTHVGTRGTVTVTGPGLPDVVVDAYGTQS